MSVDPAIPAADADESVSNDDLLALFQEQQERIDQLESDLEAERERREELEETVQKFERFTGPAVTKLINDIAQQDEVPSFDEPKIIAMAGKAGSKLQERGDRLQSLEDTTRRHESEIEESHSVAADPQAEHWQRVVQKANNVQGVSKHTLADNWVILYKEDIAGAIEPGEKRAGQLINEWTDTSGEKYKQGTEKQPYKPPASSRNGNAQKKAIKIDLDVWGDL